MTLGKILFIHFLLVVASADHVYLRCLADPETPTCSFSSSNAEVADMDDDLGDVMYFPNVPSDVWILNFEPGTPENPKTTIEESFRFQRLDIHSVFDNTANIIHDLGDCQKWMDDGTRLGVYPSLGLLRFTEESAWNFFSTYSPQAVVVCHNEVDRIAKFKQIAEDCPNSQVQRYSFRDGPFNVAAAPVGELEDDLPNGMGYFNIFYVQDCYPQGPDSAGGIYLIKSTKSHADYGHFLMTHTEIAHHSIENLEDDEDTVYTSSGITAPDAISLLTDIKVETDQNLPAHAVVTKLIMKTLEEGEAPEDEHQEFDPAIPQLEIRI